MCEDGHSITPVLRGSKGSLVTLVSELYRAIKQQAVDMAMEHLALCFIIFPPFLSYHDFFKINPLLGG